MVGLEEKVQLLEKQLSSLGMDCIRYKAQRDALSHAFFSIQSAGPASADDKAQVGAPSEPHVTHCSDLILGSL